MTTTTTWTTTRAAALLVLALCACTRAAAGAGCDGIDFGGVWTADTAEVALLSATDAANPENSTQSAEGPEKDWTVELDVFILSTFDPCTFTADLTVTSDDSTTQYNTSFVGNLLELDDNGSRRFIVEEAVPYEGFPVKRTLTTMFLLDGGDVISLDFLSRNETNGDSVLSVSALLTRGGGMVERDPCPDILGSWYSNQYDAMSVDEGGNIIELQALNMTLEVTEQHNCTFFGINSWSNGVIGADEVVTGQIGNEVAVTMMEYPAKSPPTSTTVAIIVGTVDIGSSPTMTWEYAGINPVRGRAVTFSTELARSDTPLGLDAYPDQKQVRPAPRRARPICAGVLGRATDAFPARPPPAVRGHLDARQLAVRAARSNRVQARRQQEQRHRPQHVHDERDGAVRLQVRRAHRDGHAEAHLQCATGSHPLHRTGGERESDAGLRGHLPQRCVQGAYIASSCTRAPLFRATDRCVRVL